MNRLVNNKLDKKQFKFMLVYGLDNKINMSLENKLNFF